ncbi:MAG: BtrH N-terminal domain-containing protein [Anaerolineae bacterium]
MILHDYHHFAGADWERGTIRNALDYAGVIAPHTGQPLSDAMLLGVSGGSVFGYFPFAYEGQEPHAALLINNTFTPFETLLKRLHLAHQDQSTGRAPRAVEHLQAALKAGKPAVVWTDIFTLPYNLLGTDAKMWSMMPILVYGYDETADQVWIADRARVPLTVTTDVLAQARSRTAKEKHRLVTLGAPDLKKLKSAVEDGLRDTLTFMLEGAPKGAKDNWGLAALGKWADLMVDEKSERGWSNLFPRGGALYNGLLTAFHSLAVRGLDEGEDAGRGRFAEFLSEAAVVLEKPALEGASQAYRDAVPAWQRLTRALLPAEVPLLDEARSLTLSGHRLFRDQGMDSIPERETIKARLDAIHEQMRADFPLDDAQASDLRAHIRAAVLDVQAAEHRAVETLKEAVG